MKLIVCIKEVPDTETYIKIGADQKSINEANVTFIMNPYDEYAVEEALKIQEARGGEVTAVTVGGERANDTLRTAIAMGVQNAVRIKSEQFVSDGLAIAKAYAGVIGGMGADLILLGKETIDDGSTQTGPMLGELLNLPCITMVTKLEIGDGKVTAEREVSGGVETIEAPMPCIITAQKGLNEPRYPSLRGKMMAKKAVIDEKDGAMDAVQVEILEMKSPPARGEARVVGEGADAVPELVRLLKEEAKVI
ncbi:electron transfer flavoprotein subunit beta/FixA family protein [bacterium]|nr:electron transfer flavoprotein subunit beta/FixA family protein [bacterium]